MKKKKIKIILITIFSIILLGIIFVLGINAYVKTSTKKQIIKDTTSYNFEGFDCIIVLGAKIWSDGPSPMLADRLDTAIFLYNKGAAPKIIMSGDHGQTTYDEVNPMKQYALDRGVASEDIFMDHAGFSTYESIYRAKAIFQSKKAIIVTQEYHLYRALYIASKLGLEAVGVASDPRAYAGATYRELREILARNKDFVTSIFKPKPKYLGDTIPITGDGNATDDK